MGDPLLMWKSDFGDAYTNRNLLSPEVIQQRKDSLAYILKGLPIVTIVEPGCNSGGNLKALQELGYEITGMEPNHFARRKAAELLDEPFIISDDSCYDINLPDDYADLVLTAGLLIHIPFKRLNEAITEMLRISKKYLLVVEYYSEQDIGIRYRGYNNMLWKRNWPEIFEQYSVTLIKSGYFDKSQGYDDCHWYLYQKQVSLL